MAFLEVAMKFGILGLIGVGTIMAINYLRNREEPYRDNLVLNPQDPDAPFILNVSKKCPVCLESFKEDERNPYERRLILPRCGHQIHSICYRDLKKNSITRCPMCRAIFS